MFMAGLRGQLANADSRWLRRHEAYRGMDRRGVIAADQASPGKSFSLVGFGLMGLAVVLFVGSFNGVGAQIATADVVIAQLEAGAFALALLLAALCFVRWRLVGEAGVLWLGTAAAVYGPIALGLGYFEVLSDATGNEGLLWLQPSARLGVIGLVVLALLAPQVDAKLRPTRTMATACAAIAVVAVLLQMFPSVAGFVITPGDALASGTSDGVAGAAFFAGAWSLVAVWSLWIGLHSRRHLLAWSGLWFFGFAFTQFAWLLPAQAGTASALGPVAFQVAGLLCAVIGATSELARAYFKQGSKLLETMASEQLATARIEADRDSRAEYAHEAANALAAIDSATQTLQRYQDQLDSETRAELAAAVSGEVHRLQQLISATATATAPGRFRLTEALAAVVTSARSQGVSVQLQVPDHLVAVGQPADTAQVLQNLFQNAKRYGGGKVVVRASLEGEQVVVRVEDEGPGILSTERELIFSRGGRGSIAGKQPGTGLGLYISARLMREQDGSLEVEGGSTGGACFVMRLPGFSELAVGPSALEQIGDRLDEGDELAAAQPAVLLFPQDRQRRALRVENEDGVSNDFAR